MHRPARLAPLTICLVLAAAAPAGANIGLGAALPSPAPRVVVDASGQGYVTWTDAATGAVDYCRLPAGASDCDSQQSFGYSTTAGTDTGNAPVLLTGGAVAVVDARCCDQANQKFLLTSADGGVSFSAPTPLAEDGASGMRGDVVDLPPGLFAADAPEQIITSDSGAVPGGGSIQTTPLTAPMGEPGWYTPPATTGTLSESIARQGTTLVTVYTQQTTPAAVSWARYGGSGDPNDPASWSAPQTIAPAPSADSNAQLAGGPSGIFVARSVAVAGGGEALVAQRFTGAGWTSPVIISTTASGSRFGIAETAAGIVYVIWRDATGALEYRIATDAAGTSFGAARALPATGAVGAPAIAVDAAGVGWATWTDGVSEAFALPVLPAPKTTSSTLAGVGKLSLATPRACVAAGATFSASLAFRRSARAGAAGATLARASFWVSLARVRADARAPFATTLSVPETAPAGSAVPLHARATVKRRHAHTRTTTLIAKVAVCPDGDAARAVSR